MGTWSYRTLTDEHHAGIYEVHYDEEGHVRARSTEALIEGNDPLDLGGELLNLMLAFGQGALGIKAVDDAISGGEAVHAGPRTTVREQEAHLEAAVRFLRQHLATREELRSAQWPTSKQR